MTEIIKFKSEVKKVFDGEVDVDISAHIRLDEPQEIYALIVSKHGCQIWKAGEYQHM